MTAPSPAPSASRQGRWLAAASVLALAGFTFFCWHDANRPPVRRVAGGTFIGKDVDGRLVQVCLFQQEDGWQGWFYREGREQTDRFTATNLAHPWLAAVYVREREDEPKPPNPIMASTDNPLRLNATLPRTNGWASDTANLTRQLGHLSYRRLTGLRLGRLGGTYEYVAQFPRLPETNRFIISLKQEILARCASEAAPFTGEPFGFWKAMMEDKQLVWHNQHRHDSAWQLRLLTTNLASFCVWSYASVGLNGNQERWRGETYAWQAGRLRVVELTDVFRAGSGWEANLKEQAAEKLLESGVPERICLGAAADDTKLKHFTLSPTGVQFYFNPYDIAAGVEGEFVVHFDYAELKDLLRTDGPAALLPRAP